jgi:hypothetical protein
MWFSFFTNFLIFSTAMVLCFFFNRSNMSRYYIGFVAFTGLSALVAGFGHLTVFESSLGPKMLYGSRVFSFISVYCFTYGTLRSFHYLQQKIYSVLQVSLFVGFVVWLTLHNVFTLVIVYSIFGLIVVGVTSYLLNLKTHREASILVISGVSILAFAAVIFSIFRSEDTTAAADVGHVLVSVALVVLMAGFNKVKQNEFTK